MTILLNIGATILLLGLLLLCLFAALVMFVSINPKPLRERKSDWFHIVLAVLVAVQCGAIIVTLWT